MNLSMKNTKQYLGKDGSKLNDLKIFLTEKKRCKSK